MRYRPRRRGVQRHGNSAVVGARRKDHASGLRRPASIPSGAAMPITNPPGASSRIVDPHANFAVAILEKRAPAPAARRESRPARARAAAHRSARATTTSADRRQRSGSRGRRQSRHRPRPEIRPARPVQIKRADGTMSVRPAPPRFRESSATASAGRHPFDLEFRPQDQAMLQHRHAPCALTSSGVTKSRPASAA